MTNMTNRSEMIKDAVLNLFTNDVVVKADEKRIYFNHVAISKKLANNTELSSILSVIRILEDKFEADFDGTIQKDFDVEVDAIIESFNK
jgi:hypothetical protein